MFIQLALLLVLLLVCSFAPGFFFIRRLRWTPLEKLCGSVGLSLILLYLAAWAIYCFGPSDERPLYWVVAGAAFALGGVAWQDALRLLRTFRVKQALLWFAALLGFTFLMLGIIRVYSGVGWYGDWIEHFQRSLLFLKRLPLKTPMYLRYQVPARPPLMNVLSAFFLGLTQDRFELFQAVFAFLNVLMFLPCLLILPALGGVRRRAAIPLAALFAASPMVMEEVTYTWTKALPVFFVILALALYLAGLRKNDTVRMVAAFVALSAGILAHYSAGPYLVFLSLYFLLWAARRSAWRPLLVTGAVCGLLLLTWFGWSLSAYGMKSTLGSNTAVSGAQEHSGSNVEKIAGNLFDSVVPVLLRDDAPPLDSGTGSPATRDKAFMFYQLNLIFAMGLVGGPLVVWLLFRAFRRNKAAGSENRFWAILIPVCILVGIAVVGERDHIGVPQLTLMPINVLGLCLLATYFPLLPRLVRFLLIAGCIVDFGFGIFLQAHVEGLENTPSRTVFADVFAKSQQKPAQIGATEAVGTTTWVNWALKRRYQLSQIWLADLEGRYQHDPAFQQNWPQTRAFLQQPLKEDGMYWGGWWSRHGGVASHIGDRVAGDSGAGTTVVGVLLCLAFAGFMAVMAKAAMAQTAPEGFPSPESPGVKPSAPRSAIKARRTRMARSEPSPRRSR